MNAPEKDWLADDRQLVLTSIERIIVLTRNKLNGLADERTSLRRRLREIEIEDRNLSAELAVAYRKADRISGQTTNKEKE